MHDVLTIGDGDDWYCHLRESIEQGELTMKQQQAIKSATISDVMAISVTCDECGEFCEDHYGSTMITNESKTVECRYCHAVYALPANAFRVMSKNKCKAK